MKIGVLRSRKGLSQLFLLPRGPNFRTHCPDRLPANALKFYDKEKIALGIETTINSPKEYVVKEGRHLARALNPLTGADGELLRAVAKGDYLINGCRNRDLRSDLFGSCEDRKKRARQSAKITRLLAILKVHRLILKVQKTHRYQLTANGRRVVTVLLSAHAASAQILAAA